MLTVANPIYDIVFKYLLEDERIARILLSALLKKDVVSVETRRNEYSNIARDGLSIFRIDFGATVRESDGSEHLILIELQKTWVETETLRFRQYLGAQYANPSNMSSESEGLYGIPLVTVYLLGHRVGSIEEPVLYVRRHSYDYNGREVTKGLPDPFIDSLTHESIIVQIPLLHGQVNNRLYKVLSVFDQSRQDSRSKQVLNIDETEYAGDAEMQLIVNRLLAAASDARMRHDMNVEDEYFSVIEKRDTTIMIKDRRIAEQEVKISEQEEHIAVQEEHIAAQDKQLAAQEEHIAVQEEHIAVQDKQIASQQELIRLSVKMLVDAGMSPEAVAVNLNIDVDRVRQLAGQ